MVSDVKDTAFQYRAVSITPLIIGGRAMQILLMTLLTREPLILGGCYFL
jgi:hypothetical protein